MLKRTILSTCVTALIGSGSIALAAGHGEKPKAEPWTNVSLQETLNKMPAGDATRGQKVNEMMMCNACHGETGKSPSRNYASINGQPKEYTIKMMLDYRDGRRWEDYKQSEIMVKLAQSMDDQQIADIAAFYAEQPLEAWVSQPSADAQAPEIDRLVRKGDASRMIVPCASCHGVHGEGQGIIPALSGQVPEYFVRTMKAYRDGQRHNDVNKGMSIFTTQLTDAEIQGLADYYAAMPDKKEP